MQWRTLWEGALKRKVSLRAVHWLQVQIARQHITAPRHYLELCGKFIEVYDVSKTRSWSASRISCRAQLRIQSRQSCTEAGEKQKLAQRRKNTIFEMRIVHLKQTISTHSGQKKKSFLKEKENQSSSRCCRANREWGVISCYLIRTPGTDWSWQTCHLASLQAHDKLLTHSGMVMFKDCWIAALYLQPIENACQIHDSNGGGSKIPQQCLMLAGNVQLSKQGYKSLQKHFRRKDTLQNALDWRDGSRGDKWNVHRLLAKRIHLISALFLFIFALKRCSLINTAMGIPCQISNIYGRPLIQNYLAVVQPECMIGMDVWFERWQWRDLHRKSTACLTEFDALSVKAFRFAMKSIRILSSAAWLVDTGARLGGFWHCMSSQSQSCEGHKNWPL